jgi:hypothetical protein
MEKINVESVSANSIRELAIELKLCAPFKENKARNTQKHADRENDEQKKAKVLKFCSR